MIGRLQRWFWFQLERFLVRGAYYRLLLIMMAIGGISVASGAGLYWVESGVHGDALDATWWAFLRLTDPGYLGDDEGTLRRTLSTVLTVTGYVLFMGALVATMTQGLNDQLRRLERGFTPVAMKNHIVVIGWNASTAELLAELTEPSHGMQRFLEQYGLSGLRVAVLAEEVGPDVEQALRERLGKRYRSATTVLRSGTALQASHLERVDYRNAAVILFSPPEQGREADEASDDAQLVKSIVTLARSLEGERHIPVVVASVVDPLKLDVICQTYPAGRAQLLASSRVVGRLLVRFVREPGLLRVVDELFSQQYGSELYVHRLPKLDGVSYRELVWKYDRAIVLGTVAGDTGEETVRLAPSLDECVESGAKLVLLADDGELPESRLAAPGEQSGSPQLARAQAQERSLMLVGWNHQASWMLAELESSPTERWRVLVASSLNVQARQHALLQAGVSLQRTVVEHVRLDPTSPHDIGELPLLDYETVVVLANDTLESAEDADARSLLVYRLLRARLRQLTSHPRRILVELRDPANTDLFSNVETEAIPTSLLVTHLLAQIALRPEVKPVLDALLAADGPEITMLPPEQLQLTDKRLSFAEVMLEAARAGLVAIGLQLADRRQNGGVLVNPRRNERFVLGSKDRIIVLMQSRLD